MKCKGLVKNRDLGEHFPRSLMYLCVFEYKIYFIL